MLDVTTHAIDSLAESGINRAFFEVIKRDLIHRNEVGIATYGSTLTTNNGRDALIDLYEELLDAYKYAIQYVLESDDAPEFVELIEQSLESCVSALIIRGSEGILDTHKPLFSFTITEMESTINE